MEIEKAIPIPERRSSPVSSLVKQMEVGDSVVVASRSKAQSLQLIINRSGFKAVTRMVENRKIRVWKTENK